MNTEIFDLGKIGITLGYEYNDEVIYEKLTIILYKGKSYISTKTTKGVSPEQDIETWQLVAEAKDAYHMLVDAGKITITEEEFLEQLVDATKGRYIIQGNVINTADEEDLTVEHSDLLGIDTLKLANRPSTNGMGYVILRKNKSFAEQVTKESTIYEIRYDFILTEDVTIPANCILEFNGGSISASGNNTIEGNNTGIKAGLVKIFNNIVFDGTWINNEVYPEWFNGDNDGINAAITFASISCRTIILRPSKTYIVTSTIELPDHFYIGPKNARIPINSTEYPILHTASNISILVVKADNGGNCGSVINGIFFTGENHVSNNNLKGIVFESGHNQMHFKITNCEFKYLRHGIYKDCTGYNGLIGNFEELNINHCTFGMTFECVDQTQKGGWINAVHFERIAISAEIYGVKIDYMNSIDAVTFDKCDFENIGSDYNISDFDANGSYAIKLCSKSTPAIGNISIKNCYFEYIYPVKHNTSTYDSKIEVKIGDNVYPKSLESNNNVGCIIIDKANVSICENYINKTIQLYILKNEGIVNVERNEYDIKNILSSGSFPDTLIRVVDYNTEHPTRTSIRVVEYGRDNIYSIIKSSINYIPIILQTSKIYIDTTFVDDVKVDTKPWNTENAYPAIFIDGNTNNIDSVNSGITRNTALKKLAYGFNCYNKVFIGKNVRFILKTDTIFSDAAESKLHDAVAMFEGDGNTIISFENSNDKARNLIFINCILCFKNINFHINNYKGGIGKDYMKFQNCRVHFYHCTFDRKDTRVSSWIEAVGKNNITFDNCTFNKTINSGNNTPMMMFGTADNNTVTLTNISPTYGENVDDSIMNLKEAVGNMKFIGTKPYWYNGTAWVDATGNVV